MKAKRFFSRAVTLLVFLLIGGLLFCLTNPLLIPKWDDVWKSADTVTGFYALEEDSIDTLVLGSSQVITGVSSLQLYREQGIRAYGLGTARQPMLTSYYLLKDALRTQPNLKTVVLEVAELFVDCPEANYRKVLDFMPLSSLKKEAVQAHVQWAEQADTDNGTDTAPTALEYLLPVLSYHDRWQELTKADFTYSLEDRTDLCRGYSIQAGPKIGGTYLPLEPGSTAVCAQPSKEALYYFRALCALCREKNLSLVLLKTPRTDWSIEDYNTVQALATEYDVPYLDFNTAELGQTIGYNYNTDNLKSSDTHLNLKGGQKLTSYLGRYLADTCPVIDARTNPDYAVLDADLRRYQQQVNDANLTVETDFQAYLSRLYRSRYSVLVAVNGAGTGAYTADARRTMEQFGWDPRLAAGGCYVAAIEQGKVLTEQWSRKPVTQSTTLADGVSCTLTSDDSQFTPVCSITIDGTEYALTDPGLNIVVYNHETGEVVDSVAFDFTETQTETGSEPEITATR